MSFYYPFDSLVRLADLVNDQDFTSSSPSTSNRSLLKSKGTKSSIAVPKMDLIESKDLITAVVELPGLTKDKVDISLHE